MTEYEQEWREWREQAEARISAAEARADRLDALVALMREALDEYGVSIATTTGAAPNVPSLRDALEAAAVTGDTTSGVLVDKIRWGTDGSVTVSVTPATGGVYGEESATTDEQEQDEDETGEAPVRVYRTRRSRAPRVRPEVAQLRVKNGLANIGSGTIAVLMNETHLSKSQVRAALTQLEREGKARVMGKAGKAEVWTGV